MTRKTQQPPTARGGVGSMLEIRFPSGWHASGETKQELLEKIKAHVLEHPEEALDEGALRHLIAWHTRPVGEEKPSHTGSQRGEAR
jgi:predicted small metal-binding protein